MNRSRREPTKFKFNRRRVLSSIGVAFGIAALVGGYGIAHMLRSEIHANQLNATGDVSGEPELITIAPRASAVTVAPTASAVRATPRSKSSKSSAASTIPASNPSPAGYPSSANTGFMNAPGYKGTLTNCANYTIESNTTYQFCDFPQGIAIGSEQTHPVNVKFIGCRFASNNVEDADVADYGGNITFAYSTFEPNTEPINAEPISPTTTSISATDAYEYGIDQRYTGTLTIDHSDFWGFSDAVEFGTSSASAPLTISNSWIHNPSLDPTHAQHVDGILDNNGGTSYIFIQHNTIVGNGNTQAIALQGSVPYSYVQITNNYVSGFGYTISIGTYTHGNHITFSGNVLGSDLQPNWGFVYPNGEFTTSGLGNIWQNNKFYVVPGTSWLGAKNSNLYWWPDDALPTSSGQLIGHEKDYVGP